MNEVYPMGEKPSKRAAFFSAAASVLAILGGLVLAAIPLRFRDYLVAYQLRPTARPFYPLFYGAILDAGVVIAALGVIALAKKGQARKPAGVPGLIISCVNVLVGVGLMAAIAIVLGNALYISADDMYRLFMVGLAAISLLFGAMAVAGIAGIIAFFRKTPGRRSFGVLRWIPLALAAMGVIVVGVIAGPPDAARAPFPEGLEFTTLYAQGDAGYDTFKIPTMIVAPDGTILAFAEARTDSADDWSKTDVVVRRSTDQGKTWSPLEVLFKDGRNVVGNACPVVDGSTGFIHLLFTKNNDTAFKTRSEDNGLTWATPEEITASVKLPGWTWYAFGPSHGIQLESGTLMIPADHVEKRRMSAHVVFSKDGGATWELGGSVPGGEEATLAQLDDGSLYINVRPVSAGSRVVARSYDEGLTWTDWAHDAALPDPMVQGSLIKVPRAGQGSVFLFSNPADKLHRERMTVRASWDGCETWSSKRMVLYEGLASYSALTVIDPETQLIGAYFECGANFYSEEMVFTRFPLNYVME